MLSRPIGVVDSGVGGLSVLRALRAALPAERLLYVADTAHCPYGDKPAEEVRARALAVGGWLRAQDAKLVVVACNTATGAALEELRQVLDVPVVGLEPAVKTAAARTRTRRIGVLATSGTVASARFRRLVEQHAPSLEVVAQPCPGLVELIEEGVDGSLLQERLRAYVAPLVRAGVDAVVLGCTHYPFVREALSRVLGGDVDLIDSAPAIARRATSLLDQAGLRAAEGAGSVRLLTTGEPAEVAPAVARLWGEALPVEPLAL
jgi:glutamate racemase